MVDTVCPNELQLNKINSSNQNPPFLDLSVSISYDIITTKIYVNGTTLILILYIFRFWMAIFHRAASYGVYVSQIICFAREFG